MVSSPRLAFGAWPWRAFGLLGILCCACSLEPRRPAPTHPVASPTPAPTVVAPEPFPVMLGIDVLESQDFAVLTGKRVGLLTHAAGVSRSGEPTWSVLYRAPNVQLVALFAAEHGLDGRQPASAIVPDHVHPPTGKPVYSLYGRTHRPTPAMLKAIDTMVIDLQDIGSRSYTFVAAMCETLEACLAAGKEVVVLDRPNPLGGLKADGPMVDPEWRSYVGALPIPYVHGLTIGELARMALLVPGWLDLDEEERARARLTVVPMRGWHRAMRWPDTGLKWYPTSPYVPDFAAVEGYPVTGLGCILGGWTHGIGRSHPFRGLAFPGHRADEVVSVLSALGVPGLGFRKLELVNEAGRKVEGVYIDITDWKALRPTELSFHLMRLACAWNDRNPFARATPAQQQGFNRHVGSTAWWRALVRDGARVDVRGFVDRWAAEAAAFHERSRPFWLYQD